MQRSRKYQEKTPLHLIGTDYRWYDHRKGVAGGARIKNIPGKNDRSPRVNYRMWFKDKPTQIRWYTDPSFASGANRYRYEEIRDITGSITGDEKLVRASYVPYIVGEDGTRYWLLGSFFDFPEIKVDFGGKCNRGEEPIPCASRELREETRGVMNEPVRRALADGRGTIYKGYNTSRSDKNKNKRVIFIMVDMTNHLGDLDQIGRIQAEIEKAERVSKQEEFGPLNFYREMDVFRGRDTRKNNARIYTSMALTDFVNYLNHSKRQRGKRYIDLLKKIRDQNKDGRYRSSFDSWL